MSYVFGLKVRVREDDGLLLWICFVVVVVFLLLAQLIDQAKLQ